MPLTLTLTKKNEVVLDLPDGREVVLRLGLYHGSKVGIVIAADPDIRIRRRDQGTVDTPRPREAAMSRERSLDLQFLADLDQDWTEFADDLMRERTNMVSGLIDRLREGDGLEGLPPHDGPLVADLALIALRQITANILTRATQELEGEL